MCPMNERLPAIVLLCPDVCPSSGREYLIGVLCLCDCNIVAPQDRLRVELSNCEQEEAIRRFASVSHSYARCPPPPLNRRH
jgi:hypothetical protein